MCILWVRRSKYDGKYSSNIESGWLIKILPGQFIEIDFLSFDLGGDYDNKDDNFDQDCR